jgi:hypothetical protein
MRDKTIGAVIGMASPHIERILIEHSWWDDWAKPSLQSLIGAVIGLLVIHYGKQLLNSIDNWRNNRKLERRRSNGKQK